MAGHLRGGERGGGVFCEGAQKVTGNVRAVRKRWLDNCKMGCEVAGVAQNLARGWSGGSWDGLGISHCVGKGAGRLRGESVVAVGWGRAG